MAELTRLANTLSLVKNIHWIVVEDNQTVSSHIDEFLKSTGLSYTYFAVPVHENNNVSAEGRLKGAIQRNAALTWIREHNKDNISGVLYFADDDNTYNIKVFDEVKISRLS